MQLSKSISSLNRLNKGTLHEWLVASAIFSVLLLAIRVLMTNSPHFTFLCWNLFLAFIPYWITSWLSMRIDIMENKRKLFFVLIVWLLFIPNSFYIITDFFHFPTGANAAYGTSPKWFDLLLLFSFAWNGIVFGIISLRRVELIIELSFGRKFSAPVIFIVMLVSGFGIYLGRYLRFNSWDILTAPFSLISEIFNILLHPLDNGYAWGMTICYSLFMTLIYFTIKKLGEPIVLRSSDQRR